MLLQCFLISILSNLKREEKSQGAPALKTGESFSLLIRYSNPNPALTQHFYEEPDAGFSMTLTVELWHLLLPFFLISILSILKRELKCNGASALTTGESYSLLINFSNPDSAFF